MINIADGVLVIWDGKSRGSQFTLQYCRKANKKVTVILADKGVTGEKDKK